MRRASLQEKDDDLVSAAVDGVLGGSAVVGTEAVEGGAAAAACSVASAMLACAASTEVASVGSAAPPR